MNLDRRASPRSRLVAVAVVAGLHFLLALLLLRESTPAPRPDGDPSGPPLQVRLMAAPALSSGTPPLRLEPEALRFTPVLPLQMPELVLQPQPAAPGPTSVAQAAPAAAGSATAPGSPDGSTVAAASCMPLHWLQAVSRVISMALNYPTHSRQRGERGVVFVRVSLRRNGLVLRAPLLQASGFSALDAEAQDVLRRLGRLPAVPLDACRGAQIVVLDQPIVFGANTVVR